MANEQVEKYVQSLVYDVAGLLGNQQDSQESLSPTVHRKVINGGISVTVMTPHKVNKLIEEISLDNPSDGVMYPGALVKVRLISPFCELLLSPPFFEHETTSVMETNRQIKTDAFFIIIPPEGGQSAHNVH